VGNRRGLSRSGLPPLDPAYELMACSGQVDWNIRNARTAAGYAEQFRSLVAELSAKIAGLEKELADVKAATSHTGPDERPPLAWRRRRASPHQRPVTTPLQELERGLKEVHKQSR
jgi:hypothetical protein